MCKCLSLSHIAKIHIILIKLTIFSKKRGKNKSSLLFGNFKNDYLYITLVLYSKLTELLYDSLINSSIASGSEAMMHPVALAYSTREI